MINSANKYTVSDIFKTDANLTYTIPKYQREYTWGKIQWEALFDDLYTNDTGHFLGSIICINQSNDALQTQELEVVDGQQRLTTLSLLYAAVFSVINETVSNLDEDRKLELLNLKRRLILKKNSDQVKLEPSYQNYNYQDYLSVLKDANILQEAESKKNMGNRIMFKCYRYFKSRFIELKKDKNGIEIIVFSTQDIFDFIDKIGNALLVKIEVNSHSDAFTLFESLNNRGIPLSAIDLIKNKLLSKLEKSKIETIDKNFNKWNKLLQLLTDDFSVQERFLRQFYNAFKNQPDIGIKGQTLATRSNLIYIYERLIDNNAQSIFNKLYKAAENYNRIIVPENENNSSCISGSLKDLSNVGGMPAHVLLIYLIEYKSNVLSDKNMSEIINDLVRFFVRRHLTDIPPTRDLPSLFISIIESVKDVSDSNLIVSIIKKDLIDVCVDDNVFEEKLNGNIYEDNVDLTRFILCKIEESRHTKEKSVDLWARDNKNRYIFTVEHIFPQGDEIPVDWVNDIAQGNSKKAKEIQEKYVHTLGNLTLSGYNSKLSNMSFIKKRDRTDDKDNFIGYKNGLYLNEDLANKGKWVQSDIESRTIKVIEFVKHLFSFN